MPDNTAPDPPPWSLRTMRLFLLTFYPTALFILLSPGLLIEVSWKKPFIQYSTYHTSYEALVVHTVAYFLLNIFGLFVRRRDLLVLYASLPEWSPPAASEPLLARVRQHFRHPLLFRAFWHACLFTPFFAALSPGILVSVPDDDHGWEFLSLHTGIQVVCIHACAFFAIGSWIYAWILPELDESDDGTGYERLESSPVMQDQVVQPVIQEPV